MSYAGKYDSGSTPPPGTVVVTLTGNTGGAVGPNGSGNINVVGGTDIAVAGNPGTNTLTVNFTGSTSGITELTGDSGTPTTTSSVKLTGANSGSTVQFISTSNEEELWVTSNDGHNNTAIGDGATAGDGTGSNNLVVGASSGGAFTSNSNSFFGNNVAQNLTSGHDNTLVGISTGGELADGIENTALGSGALGSGASVSYSVALGSNALGALDTGDFNIAIGRDSASGLTSGGSNIYMNSSGTDETNTLRIGAATGNDTRELQASYICGIESVDLNTAEVVTVASDQLGSATLTPGSGISITPGAGVITIASTGSALQCGFSAYLTSTVANATGDNTNYQIICDGVVFDIGGDYDNTTGVFTAPITGTYFFSANLTLSNISASTTCSFFLFVPARPTLARYNPTAIADVTFGQATQIVTWVAPMTMGDTATISAQARNTTKTVSIQGDGTFAQTSFSAYLIG